MSYKTSIIKKAIEWTPKMMILWIANKVLKGIAELSDINIDLEAPKAHVQLQLFGEAEMLEIWLEGFGIIREGEGYKFILQQAKSNRLWLDNIFAHIIGKAWKIPVIPQITAYMPLIAELLQAESLGQAETE